MASAIEQPEASLGESNLSEEAKREAKRLAEQARTRKARQKQMLNLQRSSILRQEASQPARRAVLDAALAQIEGQLAKLG